MHHSFLVSKGIKNIELVDLMLHEGAGKRAANDDHEFDDDALAAYLMGTVEQ
ncbi:hypothetical protein LVY74_16820 [Acinetobacter sp. ME22]|uniref:hypothetical protein n=1 Tax=Acinetobacter sp. ME22 TaxID=2904802 RepID=UPI001EDB3401|nr:hypothetical protein [Acinetobacter sp. ME22]MCG2575201.1 hypothetical protein [Acinetobacter sp. ME22]